MATGAERTVMFKKCESALNDTHAAIDRLWWLKIFLSVKLEGKK